MNLRLLSLLALFVFARPLFAQDDPLPQITLFTDVMVYDGASDPLQDWDLLVQDERIVQISEEPLMVIQTDNVRIVAGNGMVIMPALRNENVVSLMDHLNCLEEEHLLWAKEVAEGQKCIEAGALANLVLMDCGDNPTNWLSACGSLIDSKPMVEDLEEYIKLVMIEGDICHNTIQP